jgi:hypothetical protein
LSVTANLQLAAVRENQIGWSSLPHLNHGGDFVDADESLPPVTTFCHFDITMDSGFCHWICTFTHAGMWLIEIAMEDAPMVIARDIIRALSMLLFWRVVAESSSLGVVI